MAIVFARSAIDPQSFLGDDLLGLGVDNILTQLPADQTFVLAGSEFDHLPVRRLYETILVDAGKRSQAADQTDVRSFRGLDRANAAVVRMVDVANVKTGALTAQTAGTESRNGTFMLAARIAGWSVP